MNCIFGSNSQKDLERLEINDQKIIIKKIKFFLSSPSPLSFAKTLTESSYGTYRFRINKFRVVFIVDEQTIVITRIRHRDKVY
jgi:mRNA-degrading endonuclease RelE of RelBE toxin-antitoxin system